MPVSNEDLPPRNLCGKWMPRSQTYCGRGTGHGGDCKSPAFMERQRERARAGDRPYDPVAAQRWRAKRRLARYGLTKDAFAQKLAAQGYACGMCFRKFDEGERICVDHAHACCPQEKQSCGRCVRGLLCFACNRALGTIESKQAQANQYLSKWQGGTPVQASPASA